MKRLLAVVVATGFFAAPVCHAMSSSTPEQAAWGTKDAYRNCKAAIAGSVPWPSDRTLACRAMHMCANEAVLNEDQFKSLLATIRRLPACTDP